MPLYRAQLAFIALVVSVLAGCTIRPVYSGPDVDRMAWAFHYDEPATRLAMVVRDELSVHFPPTSDLSAPRLRISARQANSGGTQSTFNNRGRYINPAFDNAQVTVYVTVTVLNESGVIFTAARFASADYQTNGQTFADREARMEAGERAAKEAAESLRLALMAKFSKFSSDN